MLGLIREADRTLQENMENHFVGDLKELGYNVVSSLKEYGHKAFDNMDEEAAISKLKKHCRGCILLPLYCLIRKRKENM